MNFKVVHTDEEYVEFFVDGVEAGFLNYDEDGSRAMDAVRDMFREIATIVGASYEEIYE